MPTIDDREVVLVSYRSREHVETLVNGWPEDLPIAVVDNSANADGVAELADSFPTFATSPGAARASHAQRISVPSPARSPMSCS